MRNQRDTMLKRITVTLVIFIGGGILLYSYRNMYYPRIQVTRNEPTEQATSEDVSNEQAYLFQVCAEKQHIYYLKLHKTGSGTLSNIFRRFGLSRNLSFAIPKRGILFPYEKIQASDIRPLSKEKYDMLIHHSTFNPAIKSSVFPEDVITVASFREPFPLYVSTYYFFRFRKSLPATLQINGSEVSQIEQYITYVFNQTVNTSTTAGNWNMNKLSMRLGVPLSMTRNRQYVRNFTQSVLTEEIDFATVQGYFEESLVLLKRKLCWQTKDILYRGLHISSHALTTFRELSPAVQSQFKELLSAEYIIFDHFENKFLEAMWKEESDFFDEVRDFKIILQVVQDFCDRNPLEQEAKAIPRSRWNHQFQVTGLDCLDMLLDDGAGINTILKAKQRE